VERVSKDAEGGGEEERIGKYLAGSFGIGGTDPS